MNAHFKQIQIDDIDFNKAYTGYLWPSDATEPLVYDGEKVDRDKLASTMPFIVEGHLWSEEDRCNIQVRSIDGARHIARIDLGDVSEEDHYLIEEAVYVAHDIPGYSHYRVFEAWEEKVDPLCEGMTVLVPAWTAFCGFKK